MLDGLDIVAIGEVPVVVDPVMIAESGATLLDPAAKAALIERVLPRASVVTPERARRPARSPAWGRAHRPQSSARRCSRSARWR